MKQICALSPSSRSCSTHSGVGDSKGNGLAEGAVQSLKEMIRVHKVTSESRIKTGLACVHPLPAWLVEHCAEQVQHRCGWSPSLPAIEGQEVLGAHAGVREFGDVSRLWQGARPGHAREVVPGIWLGKKLHSEEHRRTR